MGRTIVVLGSGPIRIGQGIEFDYCCVHAAQTLKRLDHRGVIINNNPETVSTDFDTGDALYFEPVTRDDVLRVIRQEKADGVLLQFGGQTAINLAEPLAEEGVTIFGTANEKIAAAEDRRQFEDLLSRLDIPRPPGQATRTLDEAISVADRVGYPVLVRPSFVLGGRAMEIVRDENSLRRYYREAEEANPGQPVLVDRYFEGTEVEVDVIADGETTLVPGIMQHIERAGVHSGDSIAVYPPLNLSVSVQRQCVEAACRLANELEIKGLMNIQFVVVDETAYVLEVNPRASRTVPYISKVTGVPMVELAVRCALGEKLADLGISSGLWLPGEQGQIEAFETSGVIVSPEDIPADRTPPLWAVKAPVFSFQKLGKVEPSLGPEMKSTGEVLGIGATFEGALYKAFVASGIVFLPKGQVILTVSDQDKGRAIEIAKGLAQRGYSIGATDGTHKALSEAGIKAERLNKIAEGSPNLLERLFEGEVSLMINTPGPGQTSETDAARIRRACIETGVACVTSIDTAQALAGALDVFEDPMKSDCVPLRLRLE